MSLSVTRVINGLRIAVIAIFGALSIPAAILGLVVYSDFRDRGCVIEEAMQCSDARTMLALVIAVLAAGPLLFGTLTILRKYSVAHEGKPNA